LFPVVSAIAEEFGFKAPPEVFARLSSKGFVGRLIPEHVPAETCVSLSDGDVVIPWLTPGQQNDVVLKPSVGSGAVATTLLSIAPDADPGAVIRAAILNSGIDDPQDTAWIVQARCAGDLVSLEGFACEAGGLPRTVEARPSGFHGGRQPVPGRRPHGRPCVRKSKRRSAI
jgi:hypothetical protein